MGVGLSIAHFNSDKADRDFNLTLLAIPLALVLIVPSFLKTLKRQKEQFESYRLTIEGNTLVREQHNTPTIHLSFLDVREIVKIGNGSFVIQGLNKGDCIQVPVQIEDYNEVESSLNSIMPVTTKLSKSLMQQYGWLLVLGMLAFMIVVFVSPNPFVVTSGGALLIALLGWALYECRHSKSIDEKTRKGLWWLWLLMLLVIARIVAVWLERP